MPKMMWEDLKLGGLKLKKKTVWWEFCRDHINHHQKHWVNWVE